MLALDWLREEWGAAFLLLWERPILLHQADLSDTHLQENFIDIKHLFPDLL
jgi:hypothetical protein